MVTRPPAGREFDRVAQQIPKDLLQPRGIAAQRRSVCAARSSSTATGFVCASSRTISHGQTDQRMRIAKLLAELELPFGDAGEVEQVVDQPRFQRDVALDHAEIRARPPAAAARLPAGPWRSSAPASAGCAARGKARPGNCPWRAKPPPRALSPRAAPPPPRAARCCVAMASAIGARSPSTASVSACLEKSASTPSRRPSAISG